MIWYHLDNLNDVKNTNKVLLLVKLQVLACNFTKSNTTQGCFHVFYIVQIVPNWAKSLKLSNFTACTTMIQHITFLAIVYHGS